MSTLLNTQTMSPPMDDEILANRAIDDPSAFSELYRRHFDRV